MIKSKIKVVSGGDYSIVHSNKDVKEIHGQHFLPPLQVGMTDQTIFSCLHA